MEREADRASGQFSRKSETHVGAWVNNIRKHKEGVPDERGWRALIPFAHKSETHVKPRWTIVKRSQRNRSERT